MIRNRKYVLDLSDLQYKQVRIHWKVKLLRILLWFSVSIVIALFYGTIFEKAFGSPKERLLSQQVENLKLQYSLVGMQLDKSVSSLNSFRLSDDRRYRPILNMDSIAESYRKGGFGGVDRFRDLSGYMNSDLLINFRTKMEEIKNMANVQNESFKTIAERAVEWKRELDHFPGISPVNVRFHLGEGMKLRIIHPVLGTSRMHNGQDFEVPYGTEVYATGDGIVVESGMNYGGFGNCIVIDHGYGYHSIYGHLSGIKVSKGTNVKRGDLIGISGNSGLSTGPHLHYQIEQMGHAINPGHFINGVGDEMSLTEYTEMIHAFESRSKLR